MHATLSSTYNVTTDATDWPSDLPEAERKPLAAIVGDILATMPNGLTLWVLVRCVGDAVDKRRDDFPMFSKAALWDFRYACVERALRSIGAESRWHAKGAA